MLPASISTSELRALTCYSKAAIVDLEQQGVIRRAAKDSWPMPETIVKIIGHLREKIWRGAASADARLKEARAKAIEFKMLQATNKMIRAFAGCARFPLQEKIRAEIDARARPLPTNSRARPNLCAAKAKRHQCGGREGSRICRMNSMYVFVARFWTRSSRPVELSA
jgi:hypothetical protein